MEILNAVLDEDTGKLMEYRHLMKIPNYCQLYGTSYRKQLGRIAQGMSGLVEGTDIIFFINKAYVTTARYNEDEEDTEEQRRIANVPVHNTRIKTRIFVPPLNKK